MQKTNATTHSRVHAFMHDNMKGCAFLRMRTNRTDSPVRAFACAVI